MNGPYLALALDLMAASSPTRALAAPARSAPVPFKVPIDLALVRLVARLAAALHCPKMANLARRAAWRMNGSHVAMGGFKAAPLPLALMVAAGRPDRALTALWLARDAGARLALGPVAPLPQTAPLAALRALGPCPPARARRIPAGWEAV